MKRTVEVTKSREVNICDCCEKQIDHPRRCNICSREVGFCCGATFFMHDAKHPVQLLEGTAIYLCKECDKIGKDTVGWTLHELLIDIVHRADREVMKKIKLWKTLSKDNRK